MNMKTNVGFTLIEVLVSVVILAGGLLGLAALQTTTLRNNQSAYFRTLATQLAYDMSDRMRSNMAGIGSYNNGAATNNDCEANVCTPAQMAGFDLNRWNTALGELPSGTGIVCIDSTPDAPGATPAAIACDGLGSDYAIKIWWDDSRSGSPNQLFVMSFQP
jgi:type IV pilus assembly protein PilV